MQQTTISQSTWNLLLEASHRAKRAGWASPGVFATAVGKDYYDTAGSGGLLYVGKAGGPLIGDVGIAHDQAESSRASTSWMLERRNPSAFWQFADQLQPDRTRMAWSNLAKIDTRTPRPPDGLAWHLIENECRIAMTEEICALRPRLTVFVTGSYQQLTINRVLTALGYREIPAYRETDMLVMSTAGGAMAAICRHPQGWPRDPRDRVASTLRGLLTRDGGMTAA